ncbi:inositol monophosphatase [Mycobacterium yunnanensis]|uniref:Inositol-1-monophosphatase n=1 Tax=Mycobacterium yunnanensis TaxID=368477 RepID=A0A9X3BVD8_9MYCO|nr:inositol monophosphatase family protein [Mycobacterium yunnanensis]MCV7423260.1 inositol monophosphatase [Mycobacterium yunnanensis]
MCCDEGVTVDHDPEHLRAVAERLAEEAAAFVRRRRAEVFGADSPPDAAAATRTKSTPTDPVTIVDTETERLLRERLAELRPGDPIVGEEEGGSAVGHAGTPTWVLDPIDGTVNFLYGLEAYAVSVGVQIDGRSVAGAVANVPTGETFSAALGAGSHLRRDGASTRLRCNPVDDLSMALVGTGFAYSPQRRLQQAEVMARLIPGVRDVRRVGSCALDLCMVAAGRLDAYYELGVNVWDWAAGALIAAEAGATMILPPVEDAGEGGLIVAAAPGVAQQFEDALRGAGAM